MTDIQNIKNSYRSTKKDHLKMSKRLHRLFTKEDILIANNHRERCSHFSAIREMQT